MKSQRIDIASIRREQIVEAAVAVITERGLQNLSLSEIETRAGMSRGQLTYYFRSKEDILLAVFDRLVLLMYQRIGVPERQGNGEAGGWDWVQYLLEKLLVSPPVSPQFGCLQYTFLSQIGYREDYRKRLASLYETWRNNMALGLAADMDRRRAQRRVSPRALATFVQALLHGLAMQRAADADAFNQQEMMDLCLDVLGTLLGHPQRSRSTKKRARHKAGRPARRGRVSRRPGASAAKEVNGERV